MMMLINDLFFFFFKSIFKTVCCEKEFGKYFVDDTF